nr:rRNA biogenesis protein RRP5 isoform X1 [Ipomoea batatas]
MPKRHLHNISPGMKLWGVIAEVNEKDIVVSLPGGLRGLVRASEAHDPLWDSETNEMEMESNYLSGLFHVGQLVSCIVLHLDDDKKEAGKRKIWLSLRLALLHKNLTLDAIQEGMILSAYIKSTEDHGYILHFGLPSFSGFLPIHSQSVDKMNTGQLVEGVVKSIDRTRKVVYLSSAPDAVAKYVTKDLKGISIDLLVPGMMVNASVLSVLENGVMLSFLTYFTGTVDIFNLQQVFPPPSWKDDYPQNKKVNARILFIDPAIRAVGRRERDGGLLARLSRRGKVCFCYILSANKEKKLLRLVLHTLLITPDDTVPSSESVRCHIREGSVLGGRISKILPGVGGLLIQVDNHLFGKVHFTELRDPWVSDPLSGYCEGQFVKCKVLEVGHSVKGTIHVDLSLRWTLDTMNNQNISEQDDVHSQNRRVLDIKDLHPDMTVQGYVKNVTPKGCFIMLSSKVDAKILISNLADGFIESPEKEFPVGKLVTGKVVSVETLSKRVEVTLRTSSSATPRKSDIDALNNFSAGNIISGKIKRIEPYGLFISVDRTNLVGLCHVSELSDDHIDNVQSRYKAGDTVRAKVLKVDKDRHRISLGMKNSYFRDDDGEDIQTTSRQSINKTDKGNNVLIGTHSTVFPESSSADIDVSVVNTTDNILTEVESRASIPPLEVPLDDIENSDIDDAVNKNPDHTGGADTTDEKDEKRAMKKAKKEREREIMAAEERLLEKDIPKNTDEFEKLVRSSPNSSFVWIKYMAFMLSLADVEKARSIAERALSTINIREESEKLNVWVAYFNLEIEYGNPPQSIVNRALLCLPRHKHIKFITQTAILEFKCGVADRGRSMFKRMLKEYPKRTDLWSVYLDQEIRLGDVDVIRALFERAISLSIPPKKMKFGNQYHPELVRPLSDQWRNYLWSNTNNGFWQHEWQEHGMLSYALFDQEQYFKRALQLLNRNNLLHALESHGITP